MTADSAQPARLEGLLAALLTYGTWLASAGIAIGLALALVAGQRGAAGVAAMPIVTAGIALFILLPVVRVMVMLIVFLRRRDYRLGGVAALVLAIILLGAVLGSLPRFQG